jgi:hypothetical protein
MLGGLLLAIIVAVADIYFLFKRLMKLDKQDEENNKTTQPNKQINSRQEIKSANKKND